MHWQFNPVSEQSPNLWIGGRRSRFWTGSDVVKLKIGKNTGEFPGDIRFNAAAIFSVNLVIFALLHIIPTGKNYMHAKIFCVVPDLRDALQKFGHVVAFGVPFNFINQAF